MKRTARVRITSCSCTSGREITYDIGISYCQSLNLMITSTEMLVVVVTSTLCSPFLLCFSAHCLVKDAFPCVPLSVGWYHFRPLSPGEVWMTVRFLISLGISRNRNFLPFWLLWPWTWPDDLHIQTWPVLLGNTWDVQIWTSYTKAFESYRLTDRQT